MSDSIFDEEDPEEIARDILSRIHRTGCCPQIEPIGQHTPGQPLQYRWRLLDQAGLPFDEGAADSFEAAARMVRDAFAQLEGASTVVLRRLPQ